MPQNLRVDLLHLSTLYTMNRTEFQEKALAKKKDFGAVPDNMKKCYRGTDEKESVKQS